MSYHVTIGSEQIGEIDYKIGDMLMNRDGRNVGICTGFCFDDTCVLIDGKCWGGKFYFHKSETEDINYETIK